MADKTLDNTDVDGASKQVFDLKVFGDGDLFKLLSKASSKSEGWMKSTKAMEIPEKGCLVQVTTQQGEYVAEALAFVPGVYVADVERDAEGKVTKRCLSSIERCSDGTE